MSERASFKGSVASLETLFLKFELGRKRGMSDVEIRPFCGLRNDPNPRRCTDLPSATTLVMVENIDSTERLDAAKLRFACAATARIKSLLLTETVPLCLQT